MKKNRWKLILLVPLVLSLTDCSSGKRIVDLNLNYIPTNRVPARTTDEQSQEQIAEAATAVGQSLQELSAVQMTVHPPRKLARPFDAHSIGMDKMASLSWTGPVEPALKKIAQATNYKFTVIGKKPVIPVFICMNVHNQPIAEILRNITYQVVMKANIAVYGKSRTIELRYHGN